MIRRVDKWLDASLALIGEAARQVSREFTATHPEIRWENIVGMRHKVVQDYLGVAEPSSGVDALEPLVPPAA